MKLISLMFQNLLRNPVRSLLTALGTMLLVFVVTLVWSVLTFIDRQTAERSENVKGIVTERWRLPSQMPYQYINTLREGAASEAGDLRPDDYMSWTFYGGSLEKDPARRTLDNSLFAFAMQPEKLTSMMEELDSLSGAQKSEFDQVVERLKATRNGVVVGQSRLKSLSKAVGGQLDIGSRIKIFSFNYREIDLELEIVGLFPPGRYDSSAVINIDYFNAAMDAYPQSHSGKPHPNAQASLNLVWLKVPSQQKLVELSTQITESPYYSSPSVKVESSSSSVGAFLEAYRDLLWGARWLLAPAILATLSLVIANAISISVRERQSEFAVMKVLGFRPSQILSLVLGEALLLGLGAGLLSAGLTYLIVNKVLGGIAFPIAFFGKFYIFPDAIWWGAAVGAITALLGSIFPALTACRVKVSDVFSRVT
jgi:putative ABC transport system permease protein